MGVFRNIEHSDGRKNTWKDGTLNNVAGESLSVFKYEQ